MPITSSNFLNKEPCYHEVPLVLFQLEQIHLNPDWQQHFLRLCQTVCDWSLDDTIVFSRHLTRHIGGLDLYLRPIPNEDELEAYHRCYFFDNERLVLIRFNGDDYVLQDVDIEQMELFLEFIRRISLDESATFIHCSMEEVAQLSTIINSETEMGHLSSYRLASDLIHHLKIIYARLINRLGDDFSSITPTEIAMILAPLVDDMAECTEGFHNRTINTVQRFALPQTLSAILMRIRMDLVDKTARDLSDDVHDHAFAYNLAHNMDFGVPVINASDEQAINHFDFEFEFSSEINKKFKEEFRPFSIILKIVEQIKMALSRYEYDGMRQQGYIRRHYEQYLAYFRLILGERVDYDCLCLDEHSGMITDINWFTVKRLIWSNLIEEDIFFLPRKGLRLIHNGIYSQVLDMINDTLCNETMDKIHYLQSMFEHHVDFIQFLQCFPELECHKKNEIMTTYIEFYSDQNRENDFALVYPLLDEITPYLSEFPSDYQTPQLISLCSLALINELEHYQHDTLFERIMKLPLRLQFKMYFSNTNQRGDNLLMILLNKRVKYRHELTWLMSCLQQTSTEIGSEFLYRVLVHQNANGINAVSLAAHLFATSSEEAIASSDILIQLVNFMGLFSTEQNESIFKGGFHGKSLLMLFVPEPLLLIQLLDLLNRFSNESRRKTLQYVDRRNGYTLLMYALRDAPEILPVLLPIMMRETPISCYKILRPSSSNTILMHIALKTPDFIVPFIALLKPLPIVLQTKLIMAQDDSGRNFLTAILEQPDHRDSAIDALLPILDELDIQDISRLFFQLHPAEKIFIRMAREESSVGIKIRQLILKKIMNCMTDEVAQHRRGSRSLNATIEEMKLELLCLVSDVRSTTLKERFNEFAKKILGRASSIQNSPGFFSAVQPNVFVSLDYLGEKLTRIITGGYANSEMLMVDLMLPSFGDACSTSVNKRVRKE